MRPRPWPSAPWPAVNHAARTNAPTSQNATTRISSNTRWPIAATAIPALITTTSSLPAGRRRNAYTGKLNSVSFQDNHGQNNYPRSLSLSSRPGKPAPLSELRGSLPGGLGGAGRAQLHQGLPGRYPIVPLVVPHGGMRQLRHDGQWRSETYLRRLSQGLLSQSHSC